MKSIGKIDEAYDNLYAAAWNYAWHSAAYYQLAEIDCIRGDFENALDHVNRSLTTDTENLKALNLRAIVLRKLHKTGEAKTQLDEILKKDVLNHQARNEESYLLIENGNNEQAKNNTGELSQIMRDEVQSYLELATDYGDAGFAKEAVDVLSRLEKKGNDFPMLYYYLGYYYSKLGEQDKALAYFKTASGKPHTYCFPFRSESVDVLNLAMKMNPKDARAPYYLGNLYYEEQPDKAIELWQNSRDLDDTFYIVHRNLALAYDKIQNDVPKAIKSMEKAVACNNKDPRLLYEMDELYEKSKASPEKKYELLKNNSETAKRRTETMLRLATRSVEVGKYDEALDILLNNEFPQFEGGREMQDTYLSAYTLRGLKYLHDGKYETALKDFQTAADYPMGRFGRSRWAQFYYLIGLANDKLGNSEKAKEAYQKCIDTNVGEWGFDQEYDFYRGLALSKTGKNDEAKALFEKMLANAQSRDNNVFFRQFEGGLSRDGQLAANHYLTGLAYEGLGEKEKAKTEFTKALELDPGHVWSKEHLREL